MTVRRLAALGAVCVALSGCATASQHHSVSLTPAQSYEAAGMTYELMLKEAIAYKDNCVARPKPLQERCMEVVRTLRDVNSEALDVFELGGMAIAESDGDLLQEAADQLEQLRDKMRQRVLDEMAAEAAASIRTETKP